MNSWQQIEKMTMMATAKKNCGFSQSCWMKSMMTYTSDSSSATGQNWNAGVS